MKVIVVCVLVLAACQTASIDVRSAGAEEDLLLKLGLARRQSTVKAGVDTHSGKPQISASYDHTFNGGNTNVGGSLNLGLDGSHSLGLSASHNINKNTQIGGNFNYDSNSGPSGGLSVTHNVPGGPSLTGNLGFGRQGPSAGIGFKHDLGNGGSLHGNFGVGRGGASVGVGVTYRFKKRNALIRSLQ